MSSAPQLLAIPLVGLAVITIVWMYIRIASRPAYARLRKHYRRLGMTAPQAPCPCGRQVSYADCCRPGDVRRLTDDIIDSQWRAWSRRSYAGRRRSSSLGDRLRDHPLPPVTLPPWVSDPDRYAFPVSFEELAAWKPPTPDLSCGVDGGGESGNLPL